MGTKLEKIHVVNDKDADVVFERTDGKRTYKIKAQWDKECGSWFQWGAPKEILSENVNDVQTYYYNKHSFSFSPGRG